MGKASKWFRSLFGFRNQDSSTSREKEKRRWSFVKSYREKENQIGTAQSRVSSSSTAPANAQVTAEHAVSVSAPTEFQAEAAVSAAKAAAAAVRMTSGNRSCENATSFAAGERAAVRIQAAFRGYLARRALRALKGLVRLQALVRGHITRKQIDTELRRMRALVRAQVRAIARRVQASDSPTSSAKSHPNSTDPNTPEKSVHSIHARGVKFNQPSTMLKRSCSKQNSRISVDHNMIPKDNEKSVKILEVDTWNPRRTSKYNMDIFHSSQLLKGSEVYNMGSNYDYSSHSCEVFSYPNEVDGSVFCTADNSPHFLSASSTGENEGIKRNNPFSPSKSQDTRSNQSSYSDCPSYMAFTESSKAKLRSLSVPKQRPQAAERSGSVKRYSIHGFADLRSSSTQRNAFTSKAYPGSGRLDRLGFPMGCDGAAYR